MRSLFTVPSYWLHFESSPIDKISLSQYWPLCWDFSLVVLDSVIYDFYHFWASISQSSFFVVPVPIVKAVQELNVKVENQQELIDEQQKLIQEQQRLIELLTQKLEEE